MTINDTRKNIWNTVECDAWSRGFDYAHYLWLYEKCEEGHSRFSEEGYRELCAVFDAEMWR
jgi:hypothetical protein